MDHTAQINKKISAKEGKVLATLFNVNKRKSQAIMQSTRVAGLKHPFNEIFALYYKESYEEAVDVADFVNFDEKWAMPIYKRIFHRLYVLSGLREEYAKVLMGMLRKVQSKDKRVYFYLTNMLISIYLKNKKFNMIDHLLSIVEEPDFVSREVVVYFYYLGLNKLTRDDFQSGYAFLRRAFRYKFIRERVALPLFVSVILNRRALRPGVLAKYGVDFAFLADLSRGTFTNEQLPSEVLIQHNLLRACRMHLPLVSLRNLVLRIYNAARNNNKLELKHLRHKLGVCTEECAAALIQLISLGYIKGYLSVNRECLVLSKTQPFPTF